MTRILIVEDEPVVAQRLQRMVNEYFAAPEHRHTTYQLHWQESLDDARDYLSSHAIDLLLLDLNLHGADGFELLQQLLAESFHTIIVSAYSDQALRAFDYGVLDFVAKPFSRERLDKALNRFTQNEGHSAHCLRQLAVKKPHGLRYLALTEVAYLQADGHYTQLHLVRGGSELHCKSIDNLMSLLPASFIRVHRSYAVQRQQISALHTQSGGSYTLALQQGAEIPVSRSRIKSLRALLSIDQ